MIIVVIFARHDIELVSFLELFDAKVVRKIRKLSKRSRLYAKVPCFKQTIFGSKIVSFSLDKYIFFRKMLIFWNFEI